MVFTSSIRLSSQCQTCETNISEQVEEVLHESGITDGIAVVSTGHTTASIHMNNADKDLEEDLHEYLNSAIVNKADYKHNKGDYGRNADAHIKSVLIGNSVTVPVTRGHLSLGEWQAIYFSEFNGPRNRLISVKVIGE